MTKPSLCFVSFAAYPLFNTKINFPHGGAELESFTLAQELTNRGYKVDFVVGNFGQPRQEIYQGVNLWRGIGLNQSNVVSGILNTWRLMCLWKKISADIYFTKGAGWLTFQLAFFCKIFHKKFIFKTSHKHNIDLSLKTKPYHIFYTWSLKKAAKVIVQNEEDIEMIKRNYKIDSILIRNYHPIPAPSMLPLPPKRKYILWAGRITATKRPEIFLDIAKDFPNESFLMLAMIVDKGFWTRVRESSKNIANLTVHTQIPHHDIDNFFAESKIFISTSHGEGFPNTFIEAMKWGVPILSLSVNPDNFINNNQVGIFASNDYQNLKSGLSIMLKNSEKWNQCSKNAYNYAGAEFGKKTIDQFIDLIQTL